VVSGIGCSSRLPGYVKAYGFNGVHGRALTLAQGVKIARPETTVLAVGGDGDGISIGAGHFPHACRRNLDITYILMDNRIYGLTKGQGSPTTELKVITKTIKYGAFEEPLNPSELALSYKASFVARGIATDAKRLTEIIQKAIAHRGFSFVHVFSRCVTFRGDNQYQEWKERAVYLEDTDYVPNDRVKAISIVQEEAIEKLGVLYQEVRPTWNDAYDEIRKIAMAGKEKYSVDDVLNQFVP